MKTGGNLRARRDVLDGRKYHKTSSLEAPRSQREHSHFVLPGQAHPTQRYKANFCPQDEGYPLNTLLYCRAVLALFTITTAGLVPTFDYWQCALGAKRALP